MSGPRRRGLADQVAAGAELAVLADGPWAHRWYWVTDLDAMRTSARRYPPSHPSGVFQNYQPTTDRLTHPEEPELTGRAYRYQPATRPKESTMNYQHGSSALAAGRGCDRG